jgi:16S rRNA (uracil1498-N3)-methyltransferase
MTLAEALEATRGFDLRLIPHLSGVRKPLRKIIAGGRAQKIAVFIGPEGDFTEREINLALRAGCVAVSLGPLVLRVETAAVAAAGFIMLNAKER